MEQGLLSHDRTVPSPEQLITMSKPEICAVLCKFVVEVKNADGVDYTHDTLYDLVIMIQSFLKQHGVVMKFLDEDVFFDLKNTLDNRMRELSKQGKISPCEKAEPLTAKDEDRLWCDGILGDKNPEQLVDTLLYLIGVHFGLRAAEEHKSLKVNCQFHVDYDHDVGLKYIEYTECTSKCNQGGLNSRFIKPKKSRTYQNVVNTDRCMVRLYEKYLSHRPSHLPKCSDDFYLRPLTVPQGDIWYSCQLRGHHKLEKVVRKMCDKAGFSGKCTNHSLRSSTATRMYDQGLDEQLICEKTGHHSVAVRSYKRTSNCQMKEVSDVLYGNCNVTESKRQKTEPTSTISKPSSELKTENEEKSGDTVAFGNNNEPENSTKSVDLGKGMIVNINFNVTK